MTTLPHDHDAAHASDVALIDLADPAERTRIHALMGACEAADGHLPFGDHELLAIQTGAVEDHIGFAVHDEGTLAGYGHLSRLGDAWFFEIAVHPEMRGRGIATRILDAIVAHTAAHGGGTLSTWAYRQAPDVGGLIRHAGLRPSRTLLQMRLNALPAAAPALPDGLVLDRFCPGIDDDEWLALNARAFAHLPDQGAWTRRDLHARISADWFDAEDVLTVRRDGTLIATCWTKLDPTTRTHDGRQLGEIYVIAVDPAEAGAGLGRILATVGLDHLRERGAQVGMLYADKDNEAAVAMYESLGFLVNHEDVCLITDVAPSGATSG
ncbi:MAG TPA: mycothiol synthase [Actinomycetota bacterium]|nr:mycothiol synthase [Actinomycetota bacterium]